MLLLGVQARQGVIQLWQAIAVSEAGTIIGSTTLYFIARFAGRTLVYRYGRYIRLTAERLDQAEGWLQKHGFWAVFFGRLAPGLRVVTAVACGVFGVSFRVFFPAMCLGALTYIVAYTLLGYFLGPPVLGLLEQVHIPVGLLGSLAPLALLIFWIRRARQDLARSDGPIHEPARNQHLLAGAMAGFLATLGSTLLLNVVINLAGNIAFNAPGTIVEQTANRIAFALARDVQPLVLFVATPVYLAVGIAWGLGYGWFGVGLFPADRPDWLKGLAYAAMPMLVSLLVVMPVLGLGFFGVGSTGPVALTGEAIRHASYGVVLGLIYPIFVSRRLSSGAPAVRFATRY
jgi:membrane protein DedA with SNARE-associated domain